MSQYIQIQAQIEQLQKEAEAARKREIAETIANIKKAIHVFGLTAEDLGLDGLIKGKRGRNPGKTAAKKSAAKKAGAKRRGRPPKADSAAKRGPKAGSKSGAKGKAAKASAKAPKKRAAKDKRSVVAPKYRDSATGATWTGRGKQPKWMAAALAAGKKIDDFKI
jgi:DNA-binding protein H-NS